MNFTEHKIKKILLTCLRDMIYNVSPSQIKTKPISHSQISFRLVVHGLTTFTIYFALH